MKWGQSHGIKVKIDGTLLVAGLFATGCSQQQSAGSQQTASSQQTAAPEPAPAPVARPPARRQAPPYRPPAMPPLLKFPPIKAKGNYKGAVQMDQSSIGMMQQYQR